MFITKKRYNEIMKERENALDLAKRTIEANGRLLTQQDSTLQLCKEINNENKCLVDELEELKKKLKEAEAKIAKKIFEDIDAVTYEYMNNEDYSMGDMIYDIDGVREKYTGETHYADKENME
jgi:predicted transcriptional regulator